MTEENATDTAVRPPNRTGIIGVFVYCGGALGGWSLSVIGSAIVMLQGDIGALLISVMFGWLMGIWGILFGLPYAALAGVIYAYLPRRFQRVAVAPFVGAASVLLLNGGFKLVTGSFDDVEGLMTLAGAGAVAAFGCAWIVQRLGLDGAGGRKPSQQRAKAWGVQD